ncbi:hypothetical protein [Arthrobacter sp. OY3WO11]|uniref:hypothetical protein n=1 Tax=Arthrobacter sp. OY3WO11 TaxID=1835723 RepID=UPI0012E8BE92|nr:hypothetical protein [Arthrobacter sp. OY3WO11]
MLGSVTSSVASVAEVLPVLPAADESAATPASAPSGLLQPAAAPLAGAADNLIASVPVVSHVVPANTVSAVTAPVTAVADDVVAGAVGAVVTPLTEAVPVLEPVVQPITDLVGGVSPVPGGLPTLPQLPAASEAEAVLEDTGVSDGGTAPAQADAGTVATESSQTSDGSEAAADPASIAAASITSEASYLTSYSASAISPTEMTGEQALPFGGSPYPAHVPAPPASSSGGSTASGAGSGPAAWLDAFDLLLPLAGDSPLGEYSEHAPSPVSFDPGSSPD